MYIYIYLYICTTHYIQEELLSTIMYISNTMILTYLSLYYKDVTIRIRDTPISKNRLK